ncbi:MAG: site-specific DNA-methyltransferase, partial [Campylobacter lanienae]
MDPPYNTGSDSFNYNDRFNHSTYLTFMKNRLEIARELLRDDGVIFVQCDDNEQAYLKVLMDEIFGRENFVNSIIWRYRTYQGQVKDFFPRKHDIILWYKKKDRPKFKLTYRDNYKDTVDYKRWQDFYVDDKIIYPNYPKTDTRFTAYFDKYVVENGEPKNGDIIYQVRGYVVDDVWEDIKAIDAKDKNQKTEFRGGQKPEELIQRILDSVTQENDLVLDFFAGSGTTLAVAHKMKRR